MDKKLNDALTLVGLLTVTSYTIDVTIKTTKKLVKKYNDKKNKSKGNTEIVVVEDYKEVE